ncbi:hypothetical protein NPIL_700091, partial [Nephila pilipes]
EEEERREEKAFSSDYLRSRESVLRLKVGIWCFLYSRRGHSGLLGEIQESGEVSNAAIRKEGNGLPQRGE